MYGPTRILNLVFKEQFNLQGTDKSLSFLVAIDFTVYYSLLHSFPYSPICYT